jgi:hypothetical protein
MGRRGCGLGCIVAGLGLVLSCALLPYLISSIYSIVSSVLQVPTAATWLWGDWLSTLVGSGNALYMLLAEGPMCCVGAVALLIVILGAVMMITGLEPGEADDAEEYESSLAPEDWEVESE